MHSFTSLVPELGERVKRVQQCFFRKASSTGKETLGVSSAFPYIIVLSVFSVSHTFLPLSPIFWLALTACLPPGKNNQVLLLSLSFLHGSPLTPGWVSNKPIICHLVYLSSFAVDLRTCGVHTWELGWESTYSANYGHRLILQKPLTYTVSSLQQVCDVIILTFLFFEGMNWILGKFNNLGLIPQLHSRRIRILS